MRPLPRRNHQADEAPAKACPQSARDGPGARYGATEDGNQLSFEGLEALLREAGHADVNIRRDWYPKMKELVSEDRLRVPWGCFEE